ncbi:MAG: SHOCT domain-containing protein [Rhodospirillales bacterium]
MAKGNYLGAEALFLSALDKDSRDVHALLGAGILYQNTGQFVKARQMYEAVLAIRPPDSEQFIALQDVTTTPVSQLASLNLSLIDSGGVLGRINKGTTSGGGSQPVSGALEMRSAMPTVSSGSAEQTAMTLAPTPSAMSQPIDAMVPDLGPSTGDKFVLSRFTTLRALRDQGLISPDEFRTRRQANIGALLPLTSPPPAAGLDRPVPTTEQISTRLQAIGRALELRAISVSQHASERNMILDAMMPAAPVVVAKPALPPQGLLEAADQVRRLERLRDNGYITSDEYARERAAIEEAMAPKDGMSAAQMSSAQPTMPVQSSMAIQPKAITQGPRPGVHLASYRSAEQAERGWSQLRRAHGEILGNLDHTVSRVDLGSKGVFYRLVAGPFASPSEATGVCTKLKSRRQFCETTMVDLG